MTSIAAFMGQDHDRLDAVLAELLRESDAGKTRDLFARLDAGLRAHIAWEEEILFPPFEERTGMRDAGPTAVMRMEHREIERLLRDIGDSAGKSDLDGPVKALIDALSPHNQKEESILYPWLDRSLSGEEASALLGRIKESRVNA